MIILNPSVALKTLTLISCCYFKHCFSMCYGGGGWLDSSVLFSDMHVIIESAKDTPFTSYPEKDEEKNIHLK